MKTNEETKNDVPYWATEQAYKNGYEKGKQDAVKQCDNIKEYVDYAIHNPNGETCEFANTEAYNRAFKAELDRLHNAVKHGRWILTHGEDGLYYDCSICGHCAGRGRKSNYCPNCGAKMDGDG